MLKYIKIIVCWIVRFGRILMYLNVTLWTLNMVCRKFKIYIPAFSYTCSYETISHMNEVNAEPPSTWYSKHIPQISKLYPYSLQSYWTSKFSKIIPYAIFAQKRTLQCVTKIILTAKLFGVGSSHFGFVHLDNWATHSTKLNKIRRRSAWGFLKICLIDVEWPCIIINISKSYVQCSIWVYF